jgi:uncharacterized protein
MKLIVERKTRAVLILLLLWAALMPCAAKEKRFPEPTGYVNDFAGVVDASLKTQITNICKELDDKTGVEIGVASFKDLGGDEIDGFTSKLFEQWNPGQRGINNGILIVDALAEQQLRIETGYGLEAIIPDAVAGRIRRDVMMPLLAANKHGDAYLMGVAALAEIAAKHENVTLSSLEGINAPDTAPLMTERSDRRHKRNFPFGIIPFFMIMILMAVARRNRGGGGYRGGGGPWIGGGGFGGFGGGGGGGFGGFGGGFSGGGGSSGGY